MRRLFLGGGMVACVGAFLLTACGSTPTATPVGMLRVATPTVTRTATSLPTPTRLPTDTATATATPRATPGPRPTLTPTPILPGEALNLTYRVEIDDPQNEQPTAWVSIDVRNCSTEEMYFLVGWPYNASDRRNFTESFQARLTNIEATRPDGTSLPIEFASYIPSLEAWGWRGAAGWIVRTESSPHFLFNFEERLVAPYDPQSYAALAMIPVGQEVASIRVVFELPQGWQAITPWSPTGHNGFDVPAAWAGSLYNYSTSPLGLATTNLPETVLSDSGFEIAFFGHFSADTIRYATDVIRWLARIHGGYDYPRYTFFGNGIRCIRCSATFVASTDQGWAEGFGSGSAREYLIASYRRGLDHFGLPVASGFHEFSHAWNVALFRDRTSAGEWWHNGIANYFEIIGPEQVFGQSDISRAWLYMAWDFYRDHRGSSYDLPLAHLNPDPSTAPRDERLMAYFKGALFYYMLDQELRAEGSSVEDLVAFLYANFKPHRNPGVLSDFVQALNTVAGRDMSPFLDRYLTGNDFYPLDELDALEPDYEQVFGSVVVR